MTTTDLRDQIRDEWDEAVTDWLRGMDGLVSWDQLDMLLDPLAAMVAPLIAREKAEAWDEGHRARDVAHDARVRVAATREAANECVNYPDYLRLMRRADLIEEEADRGE